MINIAPVKNELNYSDCSIDPCNKLKVNSFVRSELNGTIKYLMHKIARELWRRKKTCYSWKHYIIPALI